MTGTCFKLTTTILFAGFEILVEVCTEKFLLLHCTFPLWLKLALADAWLLYIEVKNNNGNNSDTCMHVWENLCLPHVVIDNTASRCFARRKVQHQHLFDWNHRETSLTVMSCSQVKARQESVTTYTVFSFHKKNFGYLKCHFWNGFGHDDYLCFVIRVLFDTAIGRQVTTELPLKEVIAHNTNILC